MEQNKIDRINELARKSKTTELTEKEKEEQRLLRSEYIEKFRAQFKAQLDQIQFVEDLEEDQKKH